MLLPEHSGSFKELARHITTIEADKLIFCPSPGNWGDSLINAGSRDFLDSHAFTFSEVKREHLMAQPNLDEAHILVGGGGGWCDFWHTTPELVSTLLPRVRHVTVLPTTFASIPVSEPTGDNLTLFARDCTFSFESRPDAQFCHDMAFHCSDWRRFSARIKEKGGIIAFRDDKESARSGPLPDENRDVSLEGKGFDDPRPLYRLLSDFERISTDRLHLAIASAQLGLEVQLFANAYPKNASVFDASMRGVYPNVAMMRSKPDDLK